ncbi:unnamed protein product [Symbiodinium sp. CCMP2592]|nr:unnamed protein product [Symbiodinium sp. CCMP2592]
MASDIGKRCRYIHNNNHTMTCLHFRRGIMVSQGMPTHVSYRKLAILHVLGTLRHHLRSDARAAGSHGSLTVLEKEIASQPPRYMGDPQGSTFSQLPAAEIHEEGKCTTCF